VSVPTQAFGGESPILRADFMSDEQKQVYDRINASTLPWATLYAEAEQSFGLQGLADMIYLIGIYEPRR